MFIVTGATGHIGNVVTRHLLGENEEVRLLIRNRNHILEGLDADIQIGDLFDRAFLYANISKGDIVIHCAGYIDLLNKHHLSTYRINYLLTKRIADVCYKRSARFVFISSVDAIDKRTSTIKEPLKIDPKKVKHTYSKSKALATKYVHRLISSGLDGIVLYPSAVIGIHDYKPSKVGKTLLSIKDKRICFTIKGGYNFIDVRDVALATYLAAKSKLREDIILTNESISIRQLYNHISSLNNKKKLIITLPTFLSRLVLFAFPQYSQMMIDVVSEKVIYDNHKMKTLIPVELRTFEETLRDTIEWFDSRH